MSDAFQKSAFSLPVEAKNVEATWLRQGFSFGIFRDPFGQEWNGFVHDTDEFVLVAEGELIVDVGDERATCKAGDLVRITRGEVHSLKTTSRAGSVWFYGYGKWETDNG
jgi:cupin 2 domain-containing protein